MLAIALSLLFGFVAFAALAEIRASLIKGLRHGRLIRAELAGMSGRREILSREAALRRARTAPSRPVAA